MSEPRSNEDQPDEEWLAARERGEDIGHVPAHKREPYERLGAMIGSGMAPSPGFRGRVLDAIDAEEAKAAEAAGALKAPAAKAEADADARKQAAAAMAESIAASVRQRVDVDLDQKRKEQKQRRARRMAVVGALAAAAAVIAVQLRRDPVEPVGKVIALNAEVKVRSSKRPVRGPDAQQPAVDDTIVVSAKTIGAAELRVYGGPSKKRLYTRCNEREPGNCTIKRKDDILEFSLEVTLPESGEVQAVVYLGEKLPASTKELNADLEAAAEAGIKYEPLKQPITVN